MPRRAVLAVTLIVGFGASAWGRVDAAPVPTGAEELRRLYPGAQLGMDQGRVRYIFGVPMTWGGTPDQAAAGFVQLHGSAFGAGPLNLQLLWSSPIREGRFTAYAYQQFIDGMPVEHGNARILVLNGAVPRVVYAAGTLASRPEGGWPAATITGAQAVRSLQVHDQFAGLPSYSTPTAVVWQGDWPTTPPRRAWKFVGEVPGIATNTRFTFFVDMATGALLQARNEIIDTDVSGTVRGWATPGVLPDITGNAPVLMGMPEIRMSITGGNNAFSDRNGNFTIPNAGTSAVTVTSNLSGGRWVDVNAQTVTELSLSLPGVVPPGNVDAQYNTPQPTPTNSPNTAQVNAFIHANSIHNYYKDRAPGFTGIDTAIPANTGVSGTCNAFFNGSSINFYNIGGGCNNSAYSTVIAHEYGHFVVNRLGLGQGGFGEGFSDVGAMLLFNTPIVGESFYTSGANIRNPSTANQQYPCSSTAVHTCGQIIGGVWWKIRVNFVAAFGAGTGLDETRDLQVAWSQITAGGQGSNFLNSAHPGTAIEVLTVDDDDGNLLNGTPRYTLICNAFAGHNIPCPTIQLLAFSYPNGQPTTLVPNQPTTVRVNVTGISGTPLAGSGMVFTSVGFGPFTGSAMNQIAPNQYEATLPAQPCGKTVRYYVSAQTTTGQTVTDPPTAPAASFSAQVSTQGATQVSVADLNFETDPGWTVANTALSTGAWERVVPVTPAQSGAPGADFDGSGRCWITDNRVGNFDVDGGPTVVTTGAYDLGPYSTALLSYARWISSVNGTVDPLIIQVSSDNGANWVTVESVTATAGSWQVREWDIGSLVPMTSQFRVRFSVSDNPNDSVTEAALDRFRIVGIQCPSACYPDCTGDGQLTIADFSCFQTRFTQGDPYADCNGDGVLTIPDFACFQTKFVAGCP